jgi:hypothetical protein
LTRGHVPRRHRLRTAGIEGSGFGRGSVRASD